MRLGARSLLPSYPEINSVTLNVILLDVYLSSRNPLGYRHHNLRFAPFHDNPVCVRDGDHAVLRRSKPTSLDCHLHPRKYADCGNAGNSRRAHRKTGGCSSTCYSDPLRLRRTWIPMAPSPQSASHSNCLQRWRSKSPIARIHCLALTQIQIP